MVSNLQSLPLRPEERILWLELFALLEPAPASAFPRMQITAGRDGLKRPHCSAHSSPAMTKQYLNHHLECPYCLTVRLRIPVDPGPENPDRLRTAANFWEHGMPGNLIRGSLWTSKLTGPPLSQLVQKSALSTVLNSASAIAPDTCRGWPVS
jgi:hypothetical protein